MFAQKVLPSLLESVNVSPHPPSLLITGATASIKGSAQFHNFAAGKFALRALGQSLAREFGPQGVHVAHIIVDGVIDIPRTREWTVNNGVENGKLAPEAVSFALGLSSYLSAGEETDVLGRLRKATGICTRSPSPRSHRR